MHCTERICTPLPESVRRTVRSRTQRMVSSLARSCHRSDGLSARVLDDRMDRGQLHAVGGCPSGRGQLRSEGTIWSGDCRQVAENAGPGRHAFAELERQQIEGAARQAREFQPLERKSEIDEDPGRFLRR